MTVSSTTSKVSYSGNGTTTAFAVSFYFLANSQLTVTLRAADGSESTKVLNTDYTVSGAGVLTGGTVTMTVAPATGTTLVISRNVPLTQETDLQPNDRLPAETLEQSIDKLTMIDQQLQEEVNRTIKFPVSDSASLNSTLVTAANRANKYLKFNASGEPEVTAGPPESFVSVDEVQYATAGQTVFTLTTITYVPGTNNLTVFVDGVNQYRGIAYQETNSTTVTFTEGLHVGAEVKFTTVRDITNTISDAATTTYLPAGSGAIQTNVQAKLREKITPLDYGAVGDGVTDDTAAIAACIAQEKPIDWLGLTYRITAPILQAVTKDVIWYGNGASIIYNASTHSEYAIRLTNAGVVDYSINDISIVGSKRCNKVFEVLSTGNLVTPAPNFVSNNFFVSEAKRSSAFNGGGGIYIRGAFDLVRFNGGGVEDCELPAGAGIPNVVGIRGIDIYWYSTSSYVRRVVLSGVTILKIYSSDLSYNFNQTGIAYFVPDAGVGLNKPLSQFLCCDNTIFFNCYGQSIKTQCRDTVIENSRFGKSEAPTAGGQSEIDAQTGSLQVTGCTFTYSDNKLPGEILNVSSDIQYENPNLYVLNNRVILDAVTEIETFVQAFTRNGYMGTVEVSNNTFIGKVKQFCNFYCNGDQNKIVVNNNYVKEIVDGFSSDKALVYLRARSIPPYFAYVTVNDNFYADTHSPKLVLGNIPSVPISFEVSSVNNLGFESSLVFDTTASTNEITTSGDIDLVLSTKRNIDSGTITIEAGADQDIVIEPDGDGQVRFPGKFLTIGSPQTADALEKVRISGTLNSDLATSYGLRITSTIPAATTATTSYFRTAANTENAAFTLTDLQHFYASQSTITGGSRTAPTNQFGFAVANSLVGATNNYGFYGNIPDGANRWNFFANGSAPNFFRGTTVVGAAALATTATDGFLYVPTCAGAPTGTPTTRSSTAPIVVDTTNHKLYFYSGGTWRDAGP